MRITYTRRSRQSVYLIMSLSEFRKAKLTYLFNLLDVDDDKLLTANDFDLIAERSSESQNKFSDGELHRRMIKSSTERYFQRLLAAMDLDHQEINLSVWLDYFEQLDREDELETDSLIQFFLEFFFGVFDADKDGFISLYEAMEFCQMVGIPIKKSKEAFQNLDINADGHVSRYELMNAVEIFLTSEDESERGNWVFGHWA